MANLKKKLYDVYAQDPTERLKALEATEGIKDATLPLAVNMGMMATPGQAGINMVRGLAGYNAINDFQNTEDPGVKDYLNVARRVALPYLPSVHGKLINAILQRFPSLSESSLPYLKGIK